MAGRPLNISNPEDLLPLWDEYKAHIDANPDIQETATGKGVFKVKVKRPYLLVGFYAFCYKKLGFHVQQYFDNHSEYPQFLSVISHIQNEARFDQFDGGLTGRYKAANLIARMHQLADNSNQNIKGTVIINRGNPNPANEPVKD